MTEFLVIQVGQCGNQIGSAFWPLILQEYGIRNIPGEVKTLQTPSKTDLNKINDSFLSFFTTEDTLDIGVNKQVKYSDLKRVKTKARAILIDMEDSVVDRFHTGALKSLFDKSCTVKNYPGSGNNWAEGYFTHGWEYRVKIEDSIRQSVEKCNCLVGFLLMYSMGGGTGSGLGSYVLQLLAELFPKIDRFVTCVYPNGSEDVITGPYNMTLATKHLTEYATCVFPVENRALLNIINKQKNKKNNTETNNFIVNNKPFQDMNSIIVNMLLHLTSGARFPGSLNVDFNDISTNLIPFPKMHFICSSVSPISFYFDRFRTKLLSRKLHNDIFIECCDKNNQLLKLNPLGLNSVLIGTALVGRGDFSVSDMRNYVDYIQKKGHFTPWSSKAMKIGLCNVPPINHDRSMMALFNTSAIASVFDEVLEQFIKLYNKKAHVHHYLKIDGFEMTYLNEAKEDLINNIKNYESLNRVKEIYTPRFNVL